MGEDVKEQTRVCLIFVKRSQSQQTYDTWAIVQQIYIGDMNGRKVNEQ